jgi:hypothetical protein
VKPFLGTNLASMSESVENSESATANVAARDMQPQLGDLSMCQDL